MSTKKKETIVRLISVDKRYRAIPYPSVPVKDESIGTFLTGQHIDPKDASTLGNLTLAEMTGEAQLSAEKAAKFPYILYPQMKEANGKIKVSSFPLKHGDKCNLTQDESGRYLYPRDKAMFDYWMFQAIIAPSKDEVKVGQHYFYIENLAAEAEKRVAKADLVFEAETLVRSSNIGKYRELALLLYHNLKNFNMVIDVLNEVQIKDKLITAAKENPQAVIDCFAKGVENDLFILKLKEKGIIVYKNGSFYDGKLFLGRTIDEVKSFMQIAANSEYVNKWGKILESENQ